MGLGIGAIVSRHLGFDPLHHAATGAALTRGPENTLAAVSAARIAASLVGSIWRGVFTMTLMERLRGHARDPATGAITSAGLMGYLQNNMRAKYTDAERQDDNYAQIPDVYAPVPFNIVPAPAGGVAPSKFPGARDPGGRQLAGSDPR